MPTTIMLIILKTTTTTITMLNPKALGLAWPSNPRDLVQEAMLDPRVLGLTIFAWPKKTTNKQMIIVHFSYQEREKKEKTQTTKETSRKKIKWESESETTITIHSEMFLNLQWFPHAI